MNYGDGIYGGMFISCMYSAAFFENDPRRIVETGLACIPSKSPYAQAVLDVLNWSKNSDDWIAVWKQIEQKWNGREPCPEGPNMPFNIDAKLNGAYVALGLLYGEGDFEKTLTITTRCGQDSDCNPASALGVLGVVLGYKGIPEKWKSGIERLADEKFRYTDYSFRTIVSSTEKRALAMITRHGGKVTAEKALVKTQAPKAAKLELWDDYGSPAERIASDDSRWSWKGKWAQTAPGGRRPIAHKLTSEKGESSDAIRSAGEP